MNSFAVVKLSENGDPYFKGLVHIGTLDGTSIENLDADYLNNHKDNIEYTILEHDNAFDVGDKHNMSESLFDTNVDDDYFDSEDSDISSSDMIVDSYELVDEHHPDYEYCVQTYATIKSQERDKVDEKVQKIQALEQLSENKGFVRASLIDDDAFFYSGGDAKPYWTGLVRVAGCEDDYVKLDILKTEMSEKSNKTFGRLPIEGDYHTHRFESLTIEELSKDDKDKCVEYAKAFDDLHKNAPYKIIGRIFSEKPTFYDWDDKKSFPRYKELEDLSKEWSVDSVHSLDDAEKWILQNHPDYYMGCSIVQNCPSGNFLASAIPCGEYPQGMYETVENRREWAKKKAADFGVEVGPFEYNPRQNKSRHKNIADRELPDANVDYGDSNDYSNSIDF